MAILLVEDEPSVRSLLTEWLLRSGYVVLIAQHAAEAMQVSERHSGNIEAVVTDFSMPGLSGIELVRELRKTRPGISAILLTGYWIHPLPEDLQIEYLSKPCSAATLLQAVKRVA